MAQKNICPILRPFPLYFVFVTQQIVISLREVLLENLKLNFVFFILYRNFSLSPMFPFLTNDTKLVTSFDSPSDFRLFLSYNVQYLSNSTAPFAALLTGQRVSSASQPHRRQIYEWLNIYI